MGIKNAHEIPKSKWIGMTWMTLALAAATLVGLVGAAFFSKEIADPQHVFIDLVKNNFSPFLVGLILCAVLAVIINAMSSQVLIVSSTLTEDFYKRLFRKNASSKELLFVSRIGVVLIALIAFAIAYAKISTIYTLVLYAWSGLGSSFGPLLLLSLYSKKVNKYGAWVGILVGGIIAAFWPYVGSNFPIDIPPMIPAFTLSFLSILAVSYATQHKTNSAGASL
jgi:sodium/proline symporter